MFSAELERERQRILDKTLRKENEIAKYLEEEELKSSSKFSGTNEKPNVVDHGDSTDDEFFELPLPPIPVVLSGASSIIENDQYIESHPAPSTSNTNKSKFSWPPVAENTREPPTGSVFEHQSKEENDKKIQARSLLQSDL